MVRAAAWFSPELDRLFRAAGGARRSIAQIDNELREAQSVASLVQQRQGEMRQEIREAASMYTGFSYAGEWPAPTTRASESFYESLPVKVKERFWELELALEDRGWQRQLALAAWEFSRYGIQQLILISRLYFIKNPLIKRGVKISSFYVFGRGVDISCEDEKANGALQDFIEANRKELGHGGLVEKDQTLRTDGNLFFVFFSSQSDGSTQVRTIDAVEMQDIITNPDDVSEPWYYLRQWNAKQFDPASGQITQEPKTAWYPAINFEPSNPPKTIRSAQVMWDMPVYHVRVGCMPKWLFGCPEVYAEIDWARAVRKNIENWFSITEAHRRFAWSIETRGGTQAMQNFSKILSTTLADGGTQIESNPPDVVASTFVSGPGNKLQPIKTAGAITSPEDVRRGVLMVCAASGLPETFYGDASTGSLATAQSLDRPTELQFLQRQELWREIIQTVCRFALSRSATAPKGMLREAWAEEAKAKSAAVTIKVDFPAILEHDITSRVAAIVESMTLNGFECSGIDEKVGVGMLLAELGYEDWPQLIDDMYPEKGKNGYDPDRTVEDEPPLPAIPKDAAPGTPGLAQAPGQQQGAPPQEPAPRKPHPKRIQPKEAVIVRAVAELRRALIEVKRNGHQA